MRCLNHYQFFLFDFDGLLVNTEEIHFLAYKQMCAHYGFQLDWSFERYCCAAHYEADAVRNQLYELFPGLYRLQPNWDILYEEKKRRVMALLQEGRAVLMPGVEKLLHLLQKANVKRCVVTHSPEELVLIIREQYPILNTIPFWVTRRDYSLPKPHPEAYLTALTKYADPGDKTIGFEDTPRGVKSLIQAEQIQPVLICSAEYPEIPEFLSKGVLHYKNLEIFLSDQS